VRRLAAVVLAGAVLVACARDDGLPGAPGDLEDLLRLVPAAAVARGLFYTDQRAAAGFGTALPLAGGALGLAADDVEQILESGEPPLTVLHGGIDGDAVDAALGRLGYRREERGSWRVYHRDGPPPAGAPPAVGAVPAAAVRDRVAVLGEAGEVAAAVDGVTPPPWLLTLSGAAGPEAAAVALSPPPDPAREARRAGTTVDGVLDRHGVRASLGSYHGYALAWQPDGAGTVALVYAPEAGGADEAAALALRIATGRLVGDVARGPTDWWEPGAPRWREQAGVAVLPVRWRMFDPAVVRSDVSAERLLFLAPR
jgi:hypothetical protein